MAYIPALQATEIDVNVSDFQFNPSTFTATVGDVIKFIWVSGFHTTTSTSVPAGATTWDQSIDASHTSYSYTVTTPGNYSYQCNFHFASGMVGSFTVNAALPIKLKEWTVSPQGNLSVIKWMTVSEENTDHFVIRRSDDGQTFNEIGTVKASGTSDGEHSYAFVDSTPAFFIRFSYYQLVTLDIDGSKQYSNIILYKRDLTNTSILIRLFPNPASSGDHLHLYFNSESNTDLKITITSSDGKLLKKVSMTASIGVNHSHMNLPNLPPGTYYINFYLNGIKEVHQIIVNK